VSVFSPGQTSFVGGEYSPRLRGRVDSEAYGVGLARCENFRPTPQGSLIMRGGTRTVDALAAGKVRFIRFLTSWGQEFLLAFSHLALRIYAPSGRVNTVPVGTELIPAGQDHGSVLSERTYDPEYDRWFDQAQTEEVFLVIAGAGDHRLSINVTSPGLRLTVTSAGAVVLSHTFHATGQYDWPMTLPLGPLTIRLLSTSTSVWGTWNSLSLEPSVNDNPDLVTPWEADDVAGLQWVEDTALDRVIFAHPQRPPQVLSLVAGTWTLAPAVFTAKPVEWAGEIWPGVVELYQGRLLLAGTPAERRRLWGAKPGSGSTAGSSFDFTVDANPDSAIDIKIATKGAIHWLQGHRGLLCATDIGEHSIGGGGLLGAIPEVRPESHYGSVAMQPLQVGDRIVFVARGGRSIRALNFSLQEDGWSARAISSIAEHLLADGVKELHFARTPDPTLFALTPAGEVRGCTLDFAEGVVAWWRVALGAPVLSATIAEGAAGGELWLGVARSSGSFIERLPLHEVGAVYADAAVVRQVPADGVVTGLEHLENETVRVIVGGAVEADQVVENGQITLDVVEAPELVGQDVVVGLPYRAKAVTLPREGGSQRGTAQGAKRRNVRVRLRLNDSALPLVNGARAAPTRSANTPMGTPEPGTTGDVEVACLGWGDGSITIEQDLPLRTEVLAVFANTAVNDL
jgi:hypothetical protein